MKNKDINLRKCICSLMMCALFAFMGFSMSTASVFADSDDPDSIDGTHSFTSAEAASGSEYGGESYFNLVSYPGITGDGDAFSQDNVLGRIYEVTIPEDGRLNIRVEARRNLPATTSMVVYFSDAKNFRSNRDYRI